MEIQQILIRDATGEDEEAIDRLVKATLPNDPHPYARNVRYPSQWINVVAEMANREVIGFATLVIEARPQDGNELWKQYPLYIGAMAVYEQYRRTGIGARILAAIAYRVIERAPHHHCLHLHVRQNNIAAVRLYEKFGFERVIECGENDDKSWLMRYDLKAGT